MSRNAEAVDFDAPVTCADGRQSPAAAMVQRGACRLLTGHGFATLCELPLASSRRADIVALNAAGEIWIVEIKSSPADYRADRKWPGYRDYCDRFFFATHADVPLAIFPETEGLILADAYGGEIMRHAQETRLGAARRKAMLVRFAQAAALRLQGVHDPGWRGLV